MIPTTYGGVAFGGGSGRERVTAAIQLASARTGVAFDYLLNQARVESSLNPNARARTSSATGLYQFIEQTWLSTVKRHGASHGLGWAADAIRRSPSGRYHVADAGMRRAILDLRKQPEASAAMAAEFASDNGRYLESRLGRRAEPVDLYLAHFLGAAGAARFLSAHDARPGAAAAPLLPAAARSNRAVFYNRDGSPRSLAEIRDRFAARMGSDGAPAAPGHYRDVRMADAGSYRSPRMAALAPPAATEAALAGRRGPRAGPTPHHARLAYLMLAQLGDLE